MIHIMWKCSMESISSPRNSIPSVQVTDVAHSLWSISSSWFFYKGIHFTKHFDVIRKQISVWIPDHTTQVSIKMIKYVVPELILVAHQTPFTCCRKRFTIREWSMLLVTSLCNEQAAGSHLLLEEADHAELGQMFCWSQYMASNCGWD